MACIVQDSLERLAALMDNVQVTLSDGTVVSVVGPRQGVGGNIPETPFIEVGSSSIELEELGNNCLITLTAQVVVSVRMGGDPARENEILNRVFCAVRQRIKDDPTLGGLVEHARLAGASVATVLVEGAEYWVMMGRAEVRYREC